MRSSGWLTGSALILMSFAFFFMGPAVTSSLGQVAETSAAAASARQEPSMQTLADLIHGLQGQIEALNQQLQQVRSEQAAQRQQNEKLLNELLEVKRQLSPTNSHATTSTVTAADVATPSTQPTAKNDPQQQPSLPDRVASIEENEQLTDEKLKDLNQTKVDSSSKYRLRLSGILLLNLFATRGAVDFQDIPEIATQPAPLQGSGAFGGSLRQTQIGLDGFGPEIWGAKTSASLKFDFAGGFPIWPNGATQGIARLRTGIIRFDWDNTSIIAGQDALFLSPLSPTSLASLAVPALAYSGNLWSWAPQVRVEHRIHVSDSSQLLLQGAVMDNLSGQIPASAYAPNMNLTPTASPSPVEPPSSGENSGQPAYAARVAWTGSLWDQPITLGTGGYYGRQNWGFGRMVDAWAGTTDVSIPLGTFVEFGAEFYRGRALGGLAGGIGQSVLWHGLLEDPTTSVYGLNAIGGWAQLKFKVTPKLQVNGAFGQDQPFAAELRASGGNQGYYNGILSKNMTPLANLIYQPRSNVAMSLEYRYLKTYPLDSFPNTANRVSLNLGYIF
jgi:hypothetical protein